MISFIVAVYNSADTLAQCLDSVIEQNSPNLELLVIDGGSTDGSLDILHHRASKIAYWTSASDQGVYDAWNKALPHVRGDWVCFLGADDYLWSKDVVEMLIEQLEDLSADVCIAYGQIVLLDKSGNPMFTLGEPWESIESQFKKKMCLPHPAVMHRQCLFDT
jgi:glycosyltransferase involved in cell wall biosynthesis